MERNEEISKSMEEEENNLNDVVLSKENPTTQHYTEKDWQWANDLC